MENKLKVEYVDIDTIKPYKNNAKLHPKEQIEQIKKSIENFGMNDPIGIWNNEIVEGHGRILACKELGYKQIPVIKLDHLTDEERKSYIIAHNKLTMNSDFDIDILRTELENLKELDFDLELTGFNVDELDDILGKNEEEQEIIEDEVPDVPEEPKAKLGDIFQLGNHRLMCGDSTKEEDVAKLMMGELADLAVTDPPYNVNIGQGGGSVCSMRIQNHRTDGATIKNDNMDDSEFIVFLIKAFKNMHEYLKNGGAFYVWHGQTKSDIFIQTLRKNQLEIREMLIWNKDRLVMGRQDYQWKHEGCVYGWKDGASHYFIDDRKQTTVFEDKKPDIKKMKKEELIKLLEEIYSDKQSTTIINEERPGVSEEHPTMKPVKLIARQVKNSSRINEKVLDLFGGSGTTLITCEQLGRKNYTMEYDPHYVDVIIQRWENFTGKKAVKLN